jgi:hypothetical protein
MKETFINWFYILTDKECRAWLFSAPNGELGKWKTVWCRLRGHPNGAWFYNMGYEPDMHCKDCNDDLG